MDVRPVERDGARFLECTTPIEQAGDALAIVAACAEHDTDRVLVERRMLPRAFFDLSSGFAGELLQKLVNYGIRTAAVLPSAPTDGARFAEFVAEARTSATFRVFDTRSEAEAWLCSPR